VQVIDAENYSLYNLNTSVQITALTNFYEEEELVNAKDVMIQAVLRAAKDMAIGLELPRLPKRQGDINADKSLRMCLNFFLFLMRGS